MLRSSYGLIILLSAIGFVACSDVDSADPSPRASTSPDDRTSPDDEASGKPGTSATSGGTTAPSTGTSGGSTSGPTASDAGADADASDTGPLPVTTAFTGADDYQAPGATPGNIAKNAHNAATGRNDGNPVGAACTNTNCHGAGNGNPTFLLGGTVYAADGTTPVANAEIRARGQDGVAVSVYSNGQGNFYLRRGNTTLAAPILVGARDGTTTAPMITTLTTANLGNCNDCHSGKAGATARVLLK